MPDRRFASLTAAVVAAGLLAVACSPGDAIREQSAAVRVGDATVSRSDFQEQLDLVYERDDLRGYLFAGVAREQLRADDDPLGSYTQQYAGALASLHVQFLLAAQVLDDEGLDLTDDDRSAVVDELDGALRGGADSLPDATRDDLVEGIAAFGRLRAEYDQDELDALVTGALTDSKIVVNSRYGSWDGELRTVTPPEGPAPAPGAGGDQSGPLPE
ncbi:MAG TPA: hypothetical protein VFZ77_15900 [Acidimicrobiales bacterium]